MPKVRSKRNSKLRRNSRVRPNSRVRRSTKLRRKSMKGGNSKANKTCPICKQPITDAQRNEDEVRIKGRVVGEEGHDLVHKDCMPNQ